ncbi:MAG: hypothetical protein KatS3mg008_2106 [Acidimicrobiales bacterium]|nr:MAG: hypothetical protein KatS3mg008_2106 [Acidimicrobiales bacterium]
MAQGSKKVQRAQRAGRRTGVAVAERKLLFPISVVGIVLVGSVLVVLARSSREEAAAVPPRLGLDHWHAAFGIWGCDKWLPNPTDTQGDRYGIHTHGDGLIHIHPTSSAAAGENAKLRVFFDEIGLEIDEDSFTTAAGDTFREGSRCKGGRGVIQLLRWRPGEFDGEPQVIEEDIADYRPRNGEALALVFRKPGEKVSPPPSVGELAAPSDLPSPSGGTEDTTSTSGVGSATTGSTTSSSPTTRPSSATGATSTTTTASTTRTEAGTAGGAQQGGDGGEGGGRESPDRGQASETSS